MRNRYLLIITIFFLFQTNIFGKETMKSIKDIILINSYHLSFTWTKDITESVIQSLPENENYRVSVEFMDTKKFNKAEEVELFRNYIKEKYASIQIDGIIVSDNYAFEFILDNSIEMWENTPVVFCGVNNIYDYHNVDTTRFKGVDETLNIAGTIQLILQAQPNLEELLVISDTTLSGKLFMNQFKTTANSVFPQLKYRPILITSEKDINNKLAYISPKNKAIYLLSLYIEKDGSSQSMMQESDNLKRTLDLPIYSNWDFLIGHGLVGGVLHKGKEQGDKAAGIMKKVLAGEADDIPYLTFTQQEYTIDYIEFTHHFGKTKPIIPNTYYINKPPSFLRKHKTSLLILSSVISVFLLIIILLIRVISIKKAAEIQIKKGEERLKLALESANIGLWDVNFDFKESYFNDRALDLLGYSKQDDFNFNLNNWSLYVHPDDIKSLKEKFHFHLTGMTENFRADIRLKSSNKEYLWYSILGMMTEKEGDRAIRMIGVILDINHRKNFEKQLQRSKEKAEESDRLKSAFLANMSHEIRTPMNAIMGFSEILIQEPVGKEDTVTYLQLIRSSGDSLLNLINDIIDISKMESGKFILSPTVFNLHELLDRIEIMAKTTMTKQLKNKVVFKLTKQVERKELLIVADRFRLEQIINNLIINAIKFTEEGVIELSYKMTDNENIIFTVSDTGQGILPEHHKVIFERFRQIDNKNYDTKGGTGLGLSITKNLITLMGGEIRVESEFNVGSKFIFNIPTSIV